MATCFHFWVGNGIIDGDALVACRLERYLVGNSRQSCYNIDDTLP